MMQEKAMVTDALNSINSGLKTYTDMISQSDNQELRSALQQMRNEAEKSQYELYTIAKNKNYYKPAEKASQDEINSLKSIFVGSTGWSESKSNSGMTGSSGMSGGSSMTGSTGTSGGSGMTNSTGSSSGSTLSGTSGMSNHSGMSGGSSLTSSTGNSAMSENSGMSNSTGSSSNLGSSSNFGSSSNLGSSGNSGSSGKYGKSVFEGMKDIIRDYSTSSKDSNQ